MSKEILIITNYYPPEKGAAANRIAQLAQKLQQYDYAVAVLCPLGNYPKGELFPQYRGKFQVKETLGGIPVQRLWVYPSISKNILVRAFSVLSFSGSLFFYLLLKKTPKQVIVQSPPLLLSFLAVFVLGLKNKKIILNVSDLWPLAAIELGLLKKGSAPHRISCFMEKTIYRKADTILGQSEEILSHIKNLFPDKKCFLYRNYPDHQDVKTAFETPEGRPIRIFYAGLLGVAQGVLELCRNIELDDKNLELHLFGDGAEKSDIAALIDSGQKKQLFFHGMLEREELHQKLSDFDIALVPLKSRIYGSVPSKLFEYGALGFPVLYCGGGEGEMVVTENKLGWVVPVGDFVALNQTLQQINQLDRIALSRMKKEVYQHSRSAFNLSLQLQQRIEDGVF